MNGLIRGLRATDGGPDVTLLIGASPMVGLTIGLGCVVVAMVYGIIAGRMLGERTGTLSGGLLLGWIAWGTGDMSMIWRFHGSTGSILAVAFEAALLGTVVLVGVVMIRTMAWRTAEDATSGRFKLTTLVSMPVLAGIAAGAVGAIAAAWLVGINALPGQALMSAVAGGITAGVVTPLVSAALSSDKPVWIAPFVALAVAGIISPLIGFISPGADQFAKAVIEGTVPGPLVVQPLGWASGILLGVPIGMAWTSASIGKVEGAASTAAARTTG